MSGKNYPVKRNFLTGLFGIIFGFAIALLLPVSPDFTSEPPFYRIIGAVLVGGGLYVMRVWPWSLKEIILETNAVVYRYRNGKEDHCERITDIGYYRRRWGKKTINMVAFRCYNPAKGKPLFKYVSAGELQGDFVPFVTRFQTLYGPRENKEV